MNSSGEERKQSEKQVEAQEEHYEVEEPSTNEPEPRKAELYVPNNALEVSRPQNPVEIEDEDDDPYYERLEIKGRGQKRLKLLFIIIGIIISIVTRFFLPTESVDCILDKTHIMLEPMNSYLHNHTDIAFYIKFMFTLMIDIMVVAAFGHWVFISQKWQFAADIILFYSVRYVLTHLISYRNPEGIYWPESSFMSLSNAGLSEQQYQVSGYSGCLVVIMFYWLNQSNPLYNSRQKALRPDLSALPPNFNLHRAQLQDLLLNR